MTPPTSVEVKLIEVTPVMITAWLDQLNMVLGYGENGSSLVAFLKRLQRQLEEIVPPDAQNEA